MGFTHIVLPASKSVLLDLFKLNELLKSIAKIKFVNKSIQIKT